MDSKHNNILLADDGHLIQAAAICIKLGLGIEVQSFYDPSLLDQEPDAVTNHLVALNQVELRASHGCFGDLCPGSFDPLVRSVARQRFEWSYDIARRLSARHLILHHGYVPHTSPPDRWLVRCSAFWKDFLADKSPDISIHIENMLEWEPGLLSDLIDAIDLPWVNANLDIGHVHCNSKVALCRWIDILGPRIGYVHLHDNHGQEDEHLGLGKGSIPLKETLDALEAAAPTALWCVEVDTECIEPSTQWLWTNGFRK
jgi:sugar phosphate isomerase/epimerase